MNVRARQGRLFGPDTLPDPDNDYEEFRCAVEQLVAAHAPGLKFGGIRISTRMRRTLGSYSPSKGEITLSGQLILSGDKKTLHKVVMHEIAHSVTSNRHPGARAHGKEFRAVCDEIGADPAPVMDVPSMSGKGPFRYVFRCASCGGRVARRRRVAVARCGCGARIRLRYDRSSPAPAAGVRQTAYSIRCPSCGGRVVRRRKVEVARCGCGARIRLRYDRVSPASAVVVRQPAANLRKRKKAQ